MSCWKSKNIILLNCLQSNCKVSIIMRMSPVRSFFVCRVVVRSIAFDDLTQLYLFSAWSFAKKKKTFLLLSKEDNIHQYFPVHDSGSHSINVLYQQLLADENKKKKERISKQEMTGRHFREKERERENE